MGLSLEIRNHDEHKEELGFAIAINNIDPEIQSPVKDLIPVLVKDSK